MLANAGRWAELRPRLSAQAQRSIAELGFVSASPVQRETIPLLLSHKDVAVEAATGSGKTLAFIVPALELILRRAESEPLKQDETLALLIGADAIFRVAERFFPPNKIGLSVCVGGRGVDEDVASLRSNGRHVVIGTPGRVRQLIDGAHLNVRPLELLILDEADRLLDMGFEREVSHILEVLPKQRRTGLFSATQTSNVKHLIRAGLRNPVGVKVTVDVMRDENGAATSSVVPQSAEATRIPSTLTNYLSVVGESERLAGLVSFLRSHGTDKVIVFCLTCAQVDYVYRVLTMYLPGGVPHALVSLHRKVPAPQRQVALDRFTNATTAAALLVTDVAARGIDLPDVDWVVQLDAPQDPKMFIHRIGRTARFGRRGCTLTFLSEHETGYVDYVKADGVQFVPMQVDTSAAPAMLEQLRKAAERDRELMEKGLLAFVSYVRAYREHLCKFIFRLDRVNLGVLARTFAILRLPRMPELKKQVDFEPSDVDPSDVPYLDALKEKQRREKQKRERERAAEERSAERGSKQEQWTQEKKRRERRKKRTQQSIRRILTDEDLDEIERDSKLLRKLKSGKITLEQYEDLTGELSSRAAAAASVAPTGSDTVGSSSASALAGTVAASSSRLQNDRGSKSRAGSSDSDDDNDDDDGDDDDDNDDGDDDDVALSHPNKRVHTHAGGTGKVQNGTRKQPQPQPQQQQRQQFGGAPGLAPGLGRAPGAGLLQRAAAPGMVSGRKNKRPQQRNRASLVRALPVTARR